MLAVIGLFWAVAGWARAGGRREVRSRILAVCGLGLAVLLALPALSALKPPTASWRLSGIRVEEAASWRMELWKLDGRTITESPVTGIGYTGFYSRLVKGFPGFYAGVSNPHNLYLTAWITGGAIGLGLLLHFLVVVIFRAVRMLRSGIPEVGAVGVAMSWYWAGYVLLGCVGQDPFPIDEALVLGTCGGLAIARVAARGGK
jgi:O-antigen ligase